MLFIEYWHIQHRYIDKRADTYDEVPQRFHRICICVHTYASCVTDTATPQWAKRLLLWWVQSGHYGATFGFLPSQSAVNVQCDPKRRFGISWIFVCRTTQHRRIALHRIDRPKDSRLPPDPHRLLHTNQLLSPTTCYTPKRHSCELFNITLLRQR